MKVLQNILCLFVLIFLVASCAPTMQPPLGPPGASSTSTASGKYVSKVDNFQVILDTSLSMDEGGQNDFLTARDIVSRINQGIPAEMKYNAGLRSFGHSSYQSKAATELLYGMANYSQNGLHDGLGKIKYTGGTSPLAAALAAAGNDLKSTSGKSALIVVSDGLHMDDAPAAAKNIKGLLGSNLCLYTIAVGHENNGAGQDLLQKVADAGQCGTATTAAALADPAKMAAFVEHVFLARPTAKPVPKPAPKPAPRDTDGDGVVDAQDQCPTTARGEFVDENGCTLKLTLHVNFDVDSAVIKPEFKADMDKAAAYIQKNSKVPYILIGGHTDQTGTVDYNQALSEQRAEAVRKALIDDYGVAASRLFARGFGKLQPIADNTTEDGRYQNRRVEIVCCVLKPE